MLDKLCNRQNPFQIILLYHLKEDTVVLIKQLAEAEEALETLDKNFGAYNDRS